MYSNSSPARDQELSHSMASARGLLNHSEKDEATIIAALLRLQKAGPSQVLLLREMALILHEVFGVSPVIVYERQTKDSLTPLCHYGIDEREVAELWQQQISEKSKQQMGWHELSAGGMKLALYLGANGTTLFPSLFELFLNQTSRELELIRWRPHTQLVLGKAPSEKEEIAIPGLICQSVAMRQIAAHVHTLRESQVTVLITGESGTGKELIARAIHALSHRSSAPFVAFNCAAVTHDLLESQLFGHRKGAFTGAHQDQQGVIRAANGGTLFLDEIGELPGTAQPKLLRFLEQREIQPLGESKPSLVDVRVLAATNRNLEELVSAGKFRSDLYYRLKVVQLHLPPLRERREEIPFLAEHFLERQCQSHHKELRLSPEVMDLLMIYDWPGNIRELANELERLVALMPSGQVITASHLSPDISRQRVSIESVECPTLEQAQAGVERRMLLEAFTRHQGNKTHVAKELGISRPTLRTMLKRHRIIPEKPD